MSDVLLQIAAREIRSHVDATQAELDAAAAAARAETIRDLRAKALQIPDDAPAALRAVCALVSETIRVGRDDGFPSVSLPDETKSVVRAAVSAGVLNAGGR